MRVSPQREPHLSDLGGEPCLFLAISSSLFPSFSLKVFVLVLLLSPQGPIFRPEFPGPVKGWNRVFNRLSCAAEAEGEDAEEDDIVQLVISNSTTEAETKLAEMIDRELQAAETGMQGKKLKEHQASVIVSALKYQQTQFRMQVQDWTNKCFLVQLCDSFHFDFFLVFTGIGVSDDTPRRDHKTSQGQSRRCLPQASAFFGDCE